MSWDHYRSEHRGPPEFLGLPIPVTDPLTGRVLLLNHAILQSMLVRLPRDTLYSILNGLVCPLPNGHEVIPSGLQSFDPLDPGFDRQHNPKAFFKVGRVFRVLWAEPAGDRQLPSSSRTSHPPRQHTRHVSAERPGCIVTGNHNGEIFHSIKIFVAIEEGQTSCTALQIASYDNRGVSKPGVIKHEHAIVYTGPEAPQPLLLEKPAGRQRGMLRLPIHVIPDGNNYLTQTSRLNFGKVHNIEHNLKVKSFGMVDSESIAVMFQHFITVHRPRLPREMIASLQQPASLNLELGGLDVDSATEDTLDLHAGSSSSDLPIYKIISARAPSADVDMNCPDYRLHKESEGSYGSGKVFTVVNYDEHSPGSSHADAVSSVVTDEVPGFSDGQPIFMQRLWFLVIKEGKDSCLCLRILSNDGQGVPEGFVKSEYAIAYTGKCAPEPEKWERATREDPTSLAMPVRIRRSDLASGLGPLSRIRLSTIYEVKHDVLSCPFGEVVEKHRWALKQQVKAHFVKLNVRALHLPDTNESGNTQRLCEYALQQLNMYQSSDDGCSSEDEAEPVPLQDEIYTPDVPERLYQDNERVLLPGRQNPSARAKFKPLRVESARLVPAGWQWEYKLKNDRHNGVFARGAFFNGARLIPGDICDIDSLQ